MAQDAGDPAGSAKLAGWEQYRRLDRLPELRDAATRTRQFSSFDRTGGNDDGFDGTYSCLRETDEGRCVVAERTGPGEVTSMWFTRFGPDGAGDVSDNGTITVELDGEPVVDAPLQALVDGELGPPFEYPLVANADQSSGGVYVKVPMPFAERMRVVLDDVLFYRLVYRAFADADGVATFDPSVPARDVLATLRDAGTVDPKPVQGAVETTERTFDVDAGETVSVAELQGSGAVSALEFRFPHVVGPDRRDEVIDDGRACADWSEFTVVVDPDNDGVRVTRRTRSGSGPQRARILVDGDPVGAWPAVGDVETTWVDRRVRLPCSATRGETELRLRNDVQETDEFAAFRYRVESLVDGEWVETDAFDVGPDATADERAREYRLAEQTWEGVERGFYPTDYGPDVADSSTFLREARLRIAFDGTTTVDAPLGEFFGCGLGAAEVRSLFFSMNGDRDGWYSAWWPMPYRRSATVELVNDSAIPAPDCTVRVTVDRSDAWADGLARGDLGYFHATSNAGETSEDDDWLYLDAGGRGTFVGVTHTARGHDIDRSYLEGDERVYVDGSRSPQLHGTGTEDFYEGGWYFKKGTFTNPFNGYPAQEVASPVCDTIGTALYRVMVGDAVPFSSLLRFGVEHGPTNRTPADYSSTAYWYGRERPALERTDSVDVGDAESESAHDYASPEPGAPRELTSTFEGDFDDVPVTDTLRDSRSTHGFTVEIDPHNDGVVIRRRSDQKAGYQAARVSVRAASDRRGDWEDVGVWRQPLANETHRWLEDAFHVPAAVTAGDEAIRVRLTPMDDAPPWAAARYDVFSHVSPFEDRDPPSRVGGLAADGGDRRVILGWTPATDDVAVARYEVYASRSPDFDAGRATLVGTTYASGFTHDGLDADETWYYRVRAVDGSDNAGPPSDVARATTDGPADA